MTKFMLKGNQKDTLPSRSRVELVASEENNYGLGPCEWTDDHPRRVLTGNSVLERWSFPATR